MLQNVIRSTEDVVALGYEPWRQLPPGVDWMNYTSMSQWAETVRDVRVEDWPLMASPVPTFVLSGIYVLLVLLGRFVIMPHRKPMSARILTPVMVLYNVVVIAINTYMFFGLLYEAYYRAGYTLVCNPVDYAESGRPVLRIVYVYYLSKLVDFSDTFFMVVRRKFDQISFLHVYHHSTMFVIWWYATKYGGGGDMIFGPLLNSFVHMIMYLYYLLALLKIHVPGKRYLTRMQMVQFFMVIFHSTASIAFNCPFPHWALYTQMVFLTSLFWLFLKFYVYAYRNARQQRQQASRGAVEAPKKDASETAKKLS